MANRPKVKINVPMCAACVLLCLTLFSCYFSGGLYARYVTQASGEDGARVARFSISINTELDFKTQRIALGKMMPGSSKQIAFTVENNSEVAVAFTTTVVNLTGNLPLEVPQSGVPQTLAPGEKETVVVTVLWDKNNADPSYAGKTDLLEIQIVTAQVD